MTKQRPKRKLDRFDSSGKSPIPESLVRAAAHPDPLPRGEGTARIAQWKAKESGLFSAASRVHPLPKGEGRGEGKETTARRSGNAQDLSCGRYPKGDSALSHS